MENFNLKTYWQALFAWYDQFGRKHLPWNTNQPYDVWLSEVMLQQTQVNTVLPYYEKFKTYFPTLADLAEADLNEVLRHWAGLGYYARARNLHKAARLLMSEFKGDFPDTLENLLRLPGVGASTAGAILAFAFNRRGIILDGNVKRVLARVFADPDQNKEKLWQLADKLTPPKRVADYTQVMMDIGALLCTRTKPRCAECPLQKCCKAFQENTVADFPVKKLTKALPEKNTLFAIMLNSKGHVLLEKRPETGIWGGLWSFPEFDNTKQLSQFQKSHALKKQKKLPIFKHTFTHYHLWITPVLLHSEKKIPRLQAYSVKDALAAPIPQPVKKILLALI